MAENHKKGKTIMVTFINRISQHNGPPTPEIKVSDGTITIKENHSKLIAMLYERDIEILDIITHPCNRGYGSLMICALIKYARQNGSKRIKGWLAEVDMGHFNRLEHFYHKFGFTIKPNPNEKSIQRFFIELNL